MKIDEIYGSDYFLSKDAKKIKNDKKIMDIHINVLILSLNVLSSARIENILPYISPIENSKRYYSTTKKQYYDSNAVMTIRTEYYFLSGIKSMSQLIDELNSIVLIHL
jgi:hypothetical protein